MSTATIDHIPEFSKETENQTITPETETSSELITIQPITLSEALHKLLEHSEGKKALLDLQMKEIRISDEEMSSINGSNFSEVEKQTIIDYKKQQLRDAINCDVIIQQLITNVVTAGYDEAAKQKAWQAVLEVILKAYYVARDDTAKFKTVRDMIDPLSVVVKSFVAEFDGKLQNNQALAAQGAQAFFRVANCYSMDDCPYTCSKWQNEAERFIFNNSLDKTQELAILYNLRAGEISRRFPLYNLDGTLNTDPFPIGCIYYFQKALDLHHEIGSTLKDTPHMRHVLMCLASVKSQELRHRLHTAAEFTPELQYELEVDVNAVFKLLEELKPHIKDDGYRMGGALQIESLLYMLQGDLTSAIESARSSLEHMPIKQTGQYSSALNNVADLHVFMGAVLYLSIDIVENIYKIMKDHPYAQMAKKMHDAAPFKIAPFNSHEEILAIANTYLVVAMACYVKSHQISHAPDKPERIYAEQAERALQQIGVEKEFVEMLYFDQDIQYFLKHCKLLSVSLGEAIPEHETEVDGQKSITNHFLASVEKTFSDLGKMLESINPFAGSAPTPKP